MSANELGDGRSGKRLVELEGWETKLTGALWLVVGSLLALAGIGKGRDGVAVFLAVGFDLGGSEAGFDVDEAELDSLGGVEGVEAFEFGGVAVGDGAIGADEKQH